METTRVRVWRRSPLPLLLPHFASHSNRIYVRCLLHFQHDGCVKCKLGCSCSTVWSAMVGAKLHEASSRV